MSSSERNPPAGGLPPANLGAVFGDAQGERRGRLASVLLSPNRTTDPVVPPADPVAEQVPANDPPPVHASAEPTVEGDLAEDQAAVVDQDDAAGTRQLIVYMPDRLRARLRKAALGSTQLDVMLDAVEQTEREGVLEQLVTRHQAPDTSGMFARRPARGSESTVQVNARAMHQHVAVLDRLADRYGTNRSELIRVALDHVLPGARRARH